MNRDGDGDSIRRRNVLPNLSADLRKITLERRSHYASQGFLLMLLRSSSPAVLCSALLMITAGCGSDQALATSEPLPTAGDPIVLEADLWIGQNAGANDDFIHPVVSGFGAAGSVYVFDIRLRELRRFSPTGEFDRLIAGPGEGPGEFRTASVSILVDSATIYIREQRGGRIIAFSASGQVVEDAAAAVPRHLEATPATLEGMSASREMILRLRHQSPPSGAAGRPTTTFRFVRAAPDLTVVDTFYTYQIPENHLSLSGGRTSVLIPSPSLGPSVSYDNSSNDLVRIDRPRPLSAEAATFTIQRISDDGQIVHSRSFHRPTFPVEDFLADSLLARIQRVGELGGGNMYESMEAAELRRVVGWPEYYPAVEQLILSEDGETVWLRMSSPFRDEQTEWHILDREFNPVQRVSLPRRLMYPKMHRNAVWGTLLDDYAPVVVRFTVP